jgi:hypothetical protein
MITDVAEDIRMYEEDYKAYLMDRSNDHLKNMLHLRGEMLLLEMRQAVIESLK